MFQQYILCRIGNLKISIQKIAVICPKLSIFLFYTHKFSAKKKIGKSANPDGQRHLKMLFAKGNAN